ILAGEKEGRPEKATDGRRGKGSRGEQPTSEHAAVPEAESAEAPGTEAESAEAPGTEAESAEAPGTEAESAEAPGTDALPNGAANATDVEQLEPEAVSRSSRPRGAPA